MSASVGWFRTQGHTQHGVTPSVDRNSEQYRYAHKVMRVGYRYDADNENNDDNLEEQNRQLRVSIRGLLETVQRLRAELVAYRTQFGDLRLDDSERNQNEG